MPNPIKVVIFKSLQDSFAENVTFHKIDDENSIIEMDYERITREILRDLQKEGYSIVLES